MKLGVVLSGGGAKGAYEVGFLKALSEFKIFPDAIAGTSIGALNGAVYCANLENSTKEAAKIVENLWLEMGSKKALKFDTKKAFINTLNLASHILSLKNSTKTEKLALVLNRTLSSKEGVLKTDELSELLKTYASFDKILKSIPFYIGLTRSDSNLSDTLKFFELKDEKVDYFRVQNMNSIQAHKAILASAALPLAFDAVEINGKFYRDGCLGSTQNELGNVPALPLVVDEKCTHLIICYLNEKSSFNKNSEVFKNVNIIEVFPKSGVFTSLKDYVNFDLTRVKELIDEGYKDSLAILLKNFKKKLF